MKDIKQILPYDYPFLMIDKILEYEKGKSLTALKNITANEWQKQGNGKLLNIFPETLIIESAAQTALLFFKLENKEKNDDIFALGQINAEFFGEVFCGEQLILETGEFKILKDKGFMDVICSVLDRKIAEVRIYFGILNKGRML